MLVKLEGLLVENSNIVVGECEVEASSTFIVSAEDSSSKGVVLLHGYDISESYLGATVYFGKDFTVFNINGISVKIMKMDNVLAFRPSPEKKDDFSPRKNV